VVIVCSFDKWYGKDGATVMGDNLAAYVEKHGGNVILLGATLWTEDREVQTYTLGGGILKEAFSPLTLGDAIHVSKYPYDSVRLVDHPITHAVKSIGTQWYGRNKLQGSGDILGEYLSGKIFVGLIGAYNKFPVVAINVMSFDDLWDVSSDFIRMIENTLKWFAVY
jgi:hypothetical protein